MQFEELEIPDVKLIFPKKFGDERGFFSETYNLEAFAKAGIDPQFVQDNHSLSSNVGVLRGLHFQCPPFAQDKLVRVIRGRILDVAVDIRAKSKTFGKWVSTEISAEDWNQIFIPAGFAHGFVTLEPNTEVNYKVSAPYAPESERAIMWNDPDLGIDWPFDENQVTLSAKDEKAMSFASYRENPVF
ncbi:MULTISPECIES: dTDP-4-dehydrorhamnose 3,5-epimerase [Thalassospira]|uniref:dTDP-4-dehydrorhamnose 3,5-epimerase n=2 Tax=Thalassospira tepidiphila TaxID=393657 RepID=A0A853KYG4_9PROT|nr:MULTISPECIES: dTDP-4-dehydrorhamnose 3,5-epimerase [Thalassospira]MBE72689.1 dTDP-4-dehydrorhamnose 3,5-epimerase [Thalassospira sp.]MBO6579257.1 dTDP-4-dehydrorhamnose 3,5-epimerase [Thalassospira sp.]MBO6803316.1 dTDP-4-dehydrorhamnose 3,5-epimerase [Thalassospira sp.]MBO6819122.1 dTDP-4-dehydrorhamnose 3,5-epimerase [Thalassospira sp.]MBO6887386.1 dTDP-4-dehydrorhamnose 3,5-epimerase [Thalassospira sp.]